MNENNEKIILLYDYNQTIVNSGVIQKSKELKLSQDKKLLYEFKL